MASKTIQHIYAAIAENPSCGSTTSYTYGGKNTTTYEQNDSGRVSFQQQVDDNNNVEVAMRTDREVFSTSLPHFGSGSFIPPPTSAAADKECLTVEAMAVEDMVAVNVVVPSSPQKENCSMGTKKYSKESLKLTPDTSPESSLEYAISSIDGSNGGNTDEYGSGPHLPSLNEQDVSFSKVGATTGLVMKKSSIYNTDAGGTFTQPNVITLEDQLGVNEGREHGMVVQKDSLSLGSSLNNSSMPDSIELSREEDDDIILHNNNSSNSGDRQQQTVSEFMKTTATPFDELSQDSISKASQGGGSSKGSDKENYNKTFQRYPSDEALINNKLSSAATTNTNADRNSNTSPTIATTQMFTTEELSSITALQISTYLTLNERQSISMKALNSNLKEYNTVSSNKVCKECNMPLLITKQQGEGESKEECSKGEGCLVCPELKKCVLQKILDGASSTTGSTSGSILSNDMANKKEKSGTNKSSYKEEGNEGGNQSQCKFLPTLPTTDNLGILQELQASLLNVYNQSMQCQADTTEYISSTTNKVYNQSIKCQQDTTEYVATTTTDAIEEGRQMLVNSKLECHEADFVKSTVDKGSEIMLGKLNRSSEASKSKEDTSANSGKKRREDTLASCNGLDFNEVKQCTVHAMELFTSSVTRQVQCKPSSSEVTKKCAGQEEYTVVDSVVKVGKNNKKKKSGGVSLLDQDDDDEQEDILVDNKVIVEDASEGDVEENGSSLLLGEGIDDEDDETYDIGDVETQPDEEQEVKKTEDTNTTIKDNNKPTSLMKTSLNIVRGIGSNISTKSLTPNTSDSFATLVTQIEEV